MDKRGAFFIIFAIAAPALLGSAGLVIDLSRVLSTRGEFNDSMRVAALQAADPTLSTLDQRQQAAQRSFNSNFPANVQGTPLIVTEQADGSIQVKGSFNMDLYFSKLISLGMLSNYNIERTVKVSLPKIDLETVWVVEARDPNASQWFLNGAKKAISDAVDYIKNSTFISQSYNGLIPFSGTIALDGSTSLAQRLTQAPVVVPYGTGSETFPGMIQTALKLPFLGLISDKRGWLPWMNIGCYKYSMRTTSPLNAITEAWDYRLTAYDPTYTSPADPTIIFEYTKGEAARPCVTPVYYYNTFLGSSRIYYKSDLTQYGVNGDPFSYTLKKCPANTTVRNSLYMPNAAMRDPDTFDDVLYTGQILKNAYPTRCDFLPAFFASNPLLNAKIVAPYDISDDPVSISGPFSIYFAFKHNLAPILSLTSDLTKFKTRLNSVQNHVFPAIPAPVNSAAIQHENKITNIAMSWGDKMLSPKWRGEWIDNPTEQSILPLETNEKRKKVVVLYLYDKTSNLISSEGIVQDTSKGVIGPFSIYGAGKSYKDVALDATDELRQTDIEPRMMWSLVQQILDNSDAFMVRNPAQFQGEGLLRIFDSAAYRPSNYNPPGSNGLGLLTGFTSPPCLWYNYNFTVPIDLSTSSTSTIMKPWIDPMMNFTRAQFIYIFITTPRLIVPGVGANSCNIYNQSATDNIGPYFMTKNEYLANIAQKEKNADISRRSLRDARMQIVKTLEPMAQYSNETFTTPNLPPMRNDVPLCSSVHYMSAPRAVWPDETSNPSNFPTYKDTFRYDSYFGTPISVPGIAWGPVSTGIENVLPSYVPTNGPRGQIYCIGNLLGKKIMYRSYMKCLEYWWQQIQMVSGAGAAAIEAYKYTPSGDLTVNYLPFNYLYNSTPGVAVNSNLEKIAPLWQHIHFHNASLVNFTNTSANPLLSNPTPWRSNASSVSIQLHTVYSVRSSVSKYAWPLHAMTMAAWHAIVFFGEFAARVAIDEWWLTTCTRSAYGYIGDGFKINSNTNEYNISIAKQKLDDNLLAVCNALRDKGVIVYIVTASNTGTDENLLKSCTKDSTNPAYYIASNQTGLATTGTQIAKHVISVNKPEILEEF